MNFSESLVVKKQFSVNDVVSIRFATGEEIIARVTDMAAYPDLITVTKPVNVQMTMTENGPALAQGPFMVTTGEDATFTINIANLMTHPIPTRDDLAKQYIKATTGLDMPPKAKIIV